MRRAASTSKVVSSLPCWCSAASDISIYLTAQNPLIFELTIDSVTTSAGLNGTEYAAFSHKFAKPVVVPPLGKANSGNITNVLLTQGATASLAIIPFQELDLLNVDVNLRCVLFRSPASVPI
jgi:hypothetical protein